MRRKFNTKADIHITLKFINGATGNVDFDTFEEAIDFLEIEKITSRITLPASMVKKV